MTIIIHVCNVHVLKQGGVYTYINRYTNLVGLLAQHYIMYDLQRIPRDYYHAAPIFVSFGVFRSSRLSRAASFRLVSAQITQIFENDTYGQH